MSLSPLATLPAKGVLRPSSMDGLFALAAGGVKVAPKACAPWPTSAFFSLAVKDLDLSGWDMI